MRRALPAALILALTLPLLLVGALTVAAQESPSPSSKKDDAGTAKDSETQGDSGVRLQKAHEADYAPALNGKKPIFILVLGSDTRSKQDQAITHSKCDSIHIVGINPDKNEASILGFPRDAWVKLPSGGNGRINEMCYGGPQSAVSTMESLTGIRMDYYAVAGFYDFRDIVSGVGTVTVNLPYAIDDSHSKAKFDKGKNRMSGKDALRYVRSRYDVPGGDFGRSLNQGHFLTEMLKQYQKQSRKDPSVLFRYLAVVLAQIKTDLSTEELLHLAFTIGRLDTDKITNRVAPGSIAAEGTESIVRLSSGANAMYADLAQDGILKG